MGHHPAKRTYTQPYSINTACIVNFPTLISEPSPVKQHSCIPDNRSEVGQDLGSVCIRVGLGQSWDRLESESGFRLKATLTVTVTTSTTTVTFES